jgi:hypothetical protein
LLLDSTDAENEVKVFLGRLFNQGLVGFLNLLKGVTQDFKAGLKFMKVFSHESLVKIRDFKILNRGCN